MVIGGLLTSTLLTTVVLPTIYPWFAKGLPVSATGNRRPCAWPGPLIVRLHKPGRRFTNRRSARPFVILFRFDTRRVKSISLSAALSVVPAGPPESANSCRISSIVIVAFERLFDLPHRWAGKCSHEPKKAYVDEGDLVLFRSYIELVDFPKLLTKKLDP